MKLKNVLTLKVYLQPSGILNFMCFLSNDPDDRWIHLVTTLTLVNCALCPLLYAYNLKDFKQAYQRTLNKMFEKDDFRLSRRSTQDTSGVENCKFYGD